MYCLMGAHNKGTAVRIIKKWYEYDQGKVFTIAPGDGLNDLPMLAEVDYPILLSDRNNTFDPRINLPGLTRAAGIGPEAWNNAVLSLLSR